MEQEKKDEIEIVVGLNLIEISIGLSLYITGRNNQGMKSKQYNNNRNIMVSTNKII